MTMKTKNLSLIQTNWTETCRSVPLELRYYLTQEDPDTARGPSRYGVIVEAYQNGESSRAEVSDITISREKIHTLIDALARGAVTPETLRDVVDDWL